MTISGVAIATPDTPVVRPITIRYLKERKGTLSETNYVVTDTLFSGIVILDSNMIENFQSKSAQTLHIYVNISTS